MKINPESWILNKDKTVLLNIDNGKAIKKRDGSNDSNAYFEICNYVTDHEGYCKLVDSRFNVSESSNESDFYVDDMLFNKLTRIFRSGFDYSDYNLY